MLHSNIQENYLYNPWINVIELHMHKNTHTLFFHNILQF